MNVTFVMCSSDDNEIKKINKTRLICGCDGMEDKHIVRANVSVYVCVWLQINNIQ